MRSSLDGYGAARCRKRGAGTEEVPFSTRSSALDVGSSEIVLHYTDDDLRDDIPDATSVLASGFETSNASYISNERLEGLAVAEAYLCLQVAGVPLKTMCKVIAPSAYVHHVLYETTGISSYVKRIIVAISGQLPNMGSDQTIYNETMDAILPCSRTCWGCH